MSASGKLNGGKVVVDDLARGWEHQRSGHLADAEACIRRFLSAHPNHAEGWAALGVVALRRKNAEEAVSCYFRSLELTPGGVEVLTNLGVAYAVNRDFPAALGALREAIAIRPSFDRALRPRQDVTSAPISVEVAPGELIDKITILEIKTERISDSAKLANVRHELRLLTAAHDRSVAPSTELDELTAKLRE